MKRVSFEVAKYLKEIGYPQHSGYNYWDGYIICKDTKPIIEEYKGEDYDCYCERLYYAPEYLDVWLWLWRIKNIKIKPIDNFATYVQGFEDELQLEGHSDPEEVIIGAIEYLVKNNLIK